MSSILKLVVKQKTVHIENYVWYCSVNIKPNEVTFQFLLHVTSEEDNLYLCLTQLLQLSPQKPKQTIQRINDIQKQYSFCGNENHENYRESITLSTPRFF